MGLVERTTASPSAQIGTVLANVGGHRPEPVSLPLAGGDALMMLTRPRSGRIRGTAVLLCPAFGWQEVCAYRGVKAWAAALAQEGYPAARLTLPSTGDSAGDAEDPGRLEAWTEAVTAAVDRLRTVTGSRRVAVIGVELGGMIAYRAQAAGAAIDDLLLWNVPARGKTLLREMRMFGRIVETLYPEDVREESTGGLNLIGYAMSGGTVEELSALDLSKLPAPARAGRRLLILGHDGVAPDPRLLRLCEDSGATVEVADGIGYEALMAPPQGSKAPLETIAQTVAWLDRGAEDAPGPAQAIASAELRCGESDRVCETPMWLSGSRGGMFGILSEPAEGPRARTCVVLLSSGGIVHSGPNRGWVELGRRWAARGIPCLRLDLPGIGEAEADDPALLETPSLHASWREREIQMVIDQLQRRGIADRFVLGGTCSGAYLSLRTGVADPLVDGLLLVNLGAFSWSNELVIERALRDSLSLALGRVSSHARQLKVVDPELWAQATRDPRAGRAGLSSARRELLLRAARQARPDRAWRVLTQSMERRERVQTRQALTVLENRGVKTLLFLSREEPLLRQLERQGFLDRLGEWPGVTLKAGGSRDHMYRATWAQREVETALDAAVDRMVASAPAEIAVHAAARPALTY